MTLILINKKYYPEHDYPEQFSRSFSRQLDILVNVHVVL